MGKFKPRSGQGGRGAALVTFLVIVGSALGIVQFYLAYRFYTLIDSTRSMSLFLDTGMDPTVAVQTFGLLLAGTLGGGVFTFALTMGFFLLVRFLDLLLFVVKDGRDETGEG